MYKTLQNILKIAEEDKASTPKKPHLQQIMSAVRRVDGRRRRRGVLDRRHAGPRPREDRALHGDGARRLAEAEAHGRRARVADRRARARVARGRERQI